MNLFGWTIARIQKVKTNVWCDLCDLLAEDCFCPREPYPLVSPAPTPPIVRPLYKTAQAPHWAEDLTVVMDRYRKILLCPMIELRTYRLLLALSTRYDPCDAGYIWPRDLFFVDLGRPETIDRDRMAATVDFAGVPWTAKEQTDSFGIALVDHHGNALTPAPVRWRDGSQFLNSGDTLHPSYTVSVELFSCQSASGPSTAPETRLFSSLPPW